MRGEISARCHVACVCGWVKERRERESERAREREEEREGEGEREREHAERERERVSACTRERERERELRLLHAKYARTFAVGSAAARSLADHAVSSFESTCGAKIALA